MGIKLEVVLILAIAAILSFSFTIKLGEDTSKSRVFTKEVEFTDTTFIEVDTSMMQGRTFTTYGVREKEILTLHNIKYHSDTIELLRAKKGTLKGDRFYLDGNVTLHQKEGFDYAAEHAVYDKKTAMLNITSPFVALMERNIIHGARLLYDTRKKEAFGERVDAVVYTNEKSESGSE